MGSAPGFLIGNRSEVSKWGFAKLDYEKGNPAPLRAVFEEMLKAGVDSEVKAEIEKYLAMLG